MSSYYSSSQGRANPLGAPSGTSQLESNSAYLKDDAPHGPVATSAVNDDGKTAQWADFFGLPRKPIPNDPGMSYGRENYDLPEAYKGSLLYLDLLIIYQIKISQMYAITRLLPLRQWEGSMSIRWDIWKFADGRLGRVPEETMSRMLTSNFDTGSATFHRWGLAFMLEHGFMNTPRGRMNYRCNLIQIANATIETLCFGVIIALLSCSPMSFMQSQAMTSINNEAQRDMLFREELDQWGCVHKMPSPVTWLWDKLTKKIRHRTNDDPNILFLPYGTRASTERPDETYFFLTGKPQDFNRGPQMPGAAVFESRDHLIGEGDVQDPAYQERIMGQYAYMLMSHLRNIKECDYLTPMMDIAMISESDDAFTRISYYQCVKECGLFYEDKSSGKWGLNELATLYFGGNYTYGDYLQEVGMLDKWCNQLADGCKKRRFDFLQKFGDTKDKQGSNPKQLAGQSFDRVAGRALLNADSVTLANAILSNTVARDPAPGGPSVPAAGGAGAGAGAGAAAAPQFSPQEEKQLRDLAAIRTWLVNANTANAPRTSFAPAASITALDANIANLTARISTKPEQKDVDALAARVAILEAYIRNNASAAAPAPPPPQNPATAPNEAARRATLQAWFATSAGGSGVDKWTVRFAATVYFATGNEDLLDITTEQLEGKAFNAPQILTATVNALNTLGTDDSSRSVALTLDGNRSNFAGARVPRDWVQGSSVLDSTSTASNIKELYAFVQSYLATIAAPNSGRDIEGVLSKFYTSQGMSGASAKQFPVDTTLLQLPFAEFTYLVNNTVAPSAGAWARDVTNKITNTGAFALVNSWSAAAAETVAGPVAARARAASLIPVGGRFVEEAKYDAGERRSRTDSGRGIQEPDYSKLASKEHLFRMVPLLTQLLGSKKNMFAFYSALVDAPRLPQIAGSTADKSRPLYPITEMAFEHLIMMLEDEYARRVDKLQEDTKTNHWTEEQVDEKRGAMDDAVKHLLQEFAFQRLLNMEDIVMLTPEFKPLFDTQMRPTALIKLASDSKTLFIGPNSSVSRTLDVFERLLPKLEDDFLTAWHNKLPDDVLWRLDQRNIGDTMNKKGGGIKTLQEAYITVAGQTKLSGVDTDAMDLKDDVPADYFKVLLKNMRIKDGELVRFGLDRNMWPIIGMLLHKLYGTWLMGQAFAMLGDGRVGYTFQGHHDFQLQDDAIHKMHVGHWTLYARPVVIRADGVAHAFNIRAERYIGGNENTIWNITDKEDRIKFNTRQFFHRSIIPVPVRINRADPYWNYDVTGAYNKHLGPTPSYCTDPSLAQWAKAWGIIQDGKNPLTRPIIPRDDVRGNTMVFLTSFLRYEEKTKALSNRVMGRSGWGADEYDGCCKVRRGLNVPLLKVGAPGTNIVSIVY